MAFKYLRAIDTVSYFFHGIPSIHFSAMDFPGTIGPNTSDWTIGVISLHNSSNQFKLGTFLSLKVWKERTVLAKSEAASFQKKLAHKQSSLWPNACIAFTIVVMLWSPTQSGQQK